MYEAFSTKRYTCRFDDKSCMSSLTHIYKRCAFNRVRAGVALTAGIASCVYRAIVLRIDGARIRRMGVVERAACFPYGCWNAAETEINPVIPFVRTPAKRIRICFANE